MSSVFSVGISALNIAVLLNDYSTNVYEQNTTCSAYLGIGHLGDGTIHVRWVIVDRKQFQRNAGVIELNIGDVTVVLG